MELQTLSSQEKQKKDAAASAKGPKQSAGELRLQKGKISLLMMKPPSYIPRTPQT